MATSYSETIDRIESDADNGIEADADNYAGLALGPALGQVVVAATEHLATTAAAAATLTDQTGEPSSDLAGTMNYLLDNILGLDRNSKLVEIVAKRGLTMDANGNAHITIDFKLSLGAWPKALIEGLPSKILSIDIDRAKLAGDHNYAIKIQDEIQGKLDEFVALYVNKAIDHIDGIEHGVAAAAGSALKHLLASEIMRPLSRELADSLLEFDLPDLDDMIEIVGDGFDALRSKYFEAFLPEIAKTYAKLGLSEILTTITSGLEPKWADAISEIGEGVLGGVINNVVNNYFLEDPNNIVNPLSNIKFTEIFGNAIANLLIDFEALDKQIIDDILGIEGDGLIQTMISDLLSDGINDFVKDRFVDAVKFLAGEFKASDLESLFSQFSSQFSIAEIQNMLGDFFISYAGNQLAQLFVNIDSLPEALVSQLGSVIGSGALGEAIGSITMSAIGDLFGVATWGAIGTSLFQGIGAILGAGIGAAAGSVVFELLDELFDGAISGIFNTIIDWIRNDSPQAFYTVRFVPGENEFVFSHESSKDSNSDMRAAVKALSDAFETRVDAIIDFVGQKASFDPGYNQVTMVWGKKHFDEKYAAFIGGNESWKLAHSSDPTTVALNAIGGVLQHMNFHSGNAILSKAYDMWKAEIAAGGGGSAAYSSANAFTLLQNIVGLAHFANAYRQDPTKFDELMASDAPIAITILQQFLEAQARGFNDATVVRGIDFDLEEIGSAAAGDHLILGGRAWRAMGRGGNDTVDGSTRDDLISGGTGNDLLRGNDGADTIAGDEGEDKIYGGEGNDTLNGGSGKDVLLGDAGNDHLDSGEGDDQLFGWTGDDTMAGGAGNDQMNGEDGNDRLDGGDGDDVLYGDALVTGNDWISGGAGDDLARGGGGDDQILGGDGNDRLHGDAGQDTMSGGAGDDLVMGGAGDDQMDGGDGVDRLMGEDGSDRIAGGLGDDSLFGLAGSDTLEGQGGADSLFGDEGDDTLAGGDGDDRLGGWVGRDTLDGGDGNDSLFGEDGDDVLTGGAGADLLVGDRDGPPSGAVLAEANVIALSQSLLGIGDFAILYQGGEYDAVQLAASDHDLLIINPARSVTISQQNSESLWSASEIAQIAGSAKTVVGYLNLAKINDFATYWNTGWTSDGTADGSLAAGAPSWLAATDAAFDHTRLVNFWEDGWRDMLFDRVDAMIAQGFDGLFLDDILEYFTRRGSTGAEIAQAAREMRDLVIEISEHARATVAAQRGAQAASDFLIIVNGAPFIIDDTSFDGSPADTAANAAFYASIDAVLAENYFSGGLDYAVTQLVEDYASRGIALLSADTGQVTRQQQIETMQAAAQAGFLPFVTSSSDYSALSPRFVPGLGDTVVPGNDTLYGGDGNDRLEGGDGSDYLFGQHNDDHLDGGAGNDTLYGGNNDDVLNGGTGNDRLEGGIGNDIYVVDDAGDTVLETADGGTSDLVRTTLASYALGSQIEALQFIGTGSFTGTGNELANSIAGGAGNDLLYGGNGNDRLEGSDGSDYLFGQNNDDHLEGGAGNDTLNGGNNDDALNGGAGDDVYIVDAADDVVTEQVGEGNDEVRTSLASYTLAGQIEALRFIGTGSFTGTGNELANNLIGGSGNDLLYGGSGNDRLEGGDGSDYLFGQHNNDHLDGGGGNDTLNGGNNDDVLNGGTGADILNGGIGNDIYVVDNAGDTVVEAADGGANDLVQTTLASYALGSHIEALQFIGTGSFTGTGNELANAIAGGSGNDLLYGGNGNDRLEGGDSDDYLFGEHNDDQLNGGAGNDTLNGGNNEDMLNGGTGADQLNGGTGNDIYVVDNAGDTVIEAADGGINDLVRTTLASYALGSHVEGLQYIGTGSFTGTGNDLANAITGGSGNDLLYGGNGNDRLEGGDSDDYLFGEHNDDHLDGGAGNDWLNGGNNDDVLNGGAGNDMLDGSAGNDAMTGGAGDDVYVVDAAGDAVTEHGGEGNDEVRTSLASYTLAGQIEALRFIGTGNFTGTGNELANAITGGAGNDLLYGGNGNDRLEGGDGNDYLFGQNNDDHLDGGAGNDTLNGGNNEDVLNGGTGADILNGGTGNDIYVVDNAGDTVIEAVDGGINDLVRTTLASYALGSHVEGLQYIGTGSFAGTGNDLANAITGGAGNDLLYGGNGNDRLEGGDSDDYLFGEHNDDHLDGGDGNDWLNGGNNDDVLNGGVGNDMLDGAAGNDIMAGGAGDDVYVVDAVGDAVTEEVGEGNDEVRTSLASYTLAGQIEALQFIGIGNFTGTGNDLANTITGGAGNDLLYGGNGSDRLEGGDGDDYLFGQHNDDHLNGGAGNDTLNGGNNDDVLNGGTGADILNGGTGNDIYVVDNAGDTVVEAADGGTSDFVWTTLASYALGSQIETMQFIGFGNFTGTGNDLANAITGGVGNDLLYGGNGNDRLEGGDGSDYLFGQNNDDHLDGGAGNDTLNGGNNDDILIGGAGNDILDGGAGNDALNGGAGDDVYIVDAAGDAVTEQDGEGSDEVRTALASYTIGANVENLTGASALGQTLNGNGASNVVTGGGGNDLLYGQGGGDIVNGASGHDYVFGNDGNDSLHGGLGNDNLNGGNDDDLIVGGAGVDSLGGGAGADIFRFDDEDSGTGGNADWLMDFVSGADRIDLSLIDANTNVGGDQAFSFLGTGAFTGVAGQLRYQSSGGNGLIQGDINGDGVADFEIAIAGTALPVLTDFML